MLKIFLGAVGLMFFNLAFAFDNFANPKPLSDDVIVSMPCDYKMVFRKVYTSNHQDKSVDATFQAGSLDNRSPLAQNPHRMHVQGGFKDKRGYYYLISKYELLDFQYQALKNPQKCPKVNRKNSLPVVNVSWFDLNEASKNYSLYLQKASDCPQNGKEKAYARLPTDEEWEFAARGGLKVSKSEFNENLPPLGGDDLSAYAWFQGPSSSNGKLQLPALKKPNPLGIYDILGNAFEMCQEPFKAVRTNRFLGQSGAMSVRGGSFKSPEVALSNATRAERPFYVNGKENRSGDLGGRLVLALSVASDSKSVKTLNAQIEALGADDSDYSADKTNTIAMIDDLKDKLEKAQAQAQEGDDIKKINEQLSLQLVALRSQVSEVNAKISAERSQAATANLRLGGFLCRSIAAQSIDIDLRKSLLKISERKCKSDPQSCGQKERNSQALKTELEVLNGLLTYYGDTMSIASDTYNLSLLKELVAEAKMSQGQNNAGLDAFIDRYFEAIAAYPKLNKDRNTIHKLWADKCYSIAKDGK